MSTALSSKRRTADKKRGFTLKSRFPYAMSVIIWFHQEENRAQTIAAGHDGFFLNAQKFSSTSNYIDRKLQRLPCHVAESFRHRSPKWFTGIKDLSLPKNRAGRKGLALPHCIRQIPEKMRFQNRDLTSAHMILPLCENNQ